MINLNLPLYNFKFRFDKNRQYIFDEVRKKYVVNTPEEWVRQNFLKYLVTEKSYPQSLISLEYEIKVNRLSKRCDAVIFNRKGISKMIIEFKAPDIIINQHSFDQIVRYNTKLMVPFLLVSNGLKHFCCKIDYEKNDYSYIKEIPTFDVLCDH